jgi:hypothetical protein
VLPNPYENPVTVRDFSFVYEDHKSLCARGGDVLEK